MSSATCVRPGRPAQLPQSALLQTGNLPDPDMQIVGELRGAESARRVHARRQLQHNTELIRQVAEARVQPADRGDQCQHPRPLAPAQVPQSA